MYFFFHPDKSKPFSHTKPFTDSWQHDVVLPRLLIDTSVLAQTRPEWAFNSPQLFWRWSRCRQECLLSGLRCFVVGCNNEHSNRPLFPTSEPLKTQWITFVWKECTLKNPTIYLNVSMFVRIIRDPSFTYSEYKVFLRIFCKSPFPNNVLVSKFHNESG